MSIYNTESNVLFITNPTVAGAAIENRKEIGGSRGHHNIYYFKQKLANKEFQEAFKFAFVRNPFDRMIAAFLRGEIRCKDFTLEETKKALIDWFRDEPKNSHRSFTNKDLRDKLCVKNHVGRIGIMSFAPQWYYLCDEEGNIPLNFVGRFENKESDWGKVCKVLNIEHKKLPLININKRYEQSLYRDYYTQESEDFVRKIYKNDFELFDYSEDLWAT